MSFCRICLKPITPRTVDLDPTLDAFYDELVYYDVIQHSALSVCTYCEHLLRKAYNIRQRCRRAHILLKSWSKDKEKKIALNFLWKLLPTNPITMVNNHSVQKLFAYINKKPETDTETTIDNDEFASLVPINYKQKSKKDIKTYYQEFIGDIELKLKEDDENNANEFKTAGDNENADDPNKIESDNESDVVFDDNFEDFFKSEVELDDVELKGTDLRESIKKKRKERILTKRRAKSRAVLEKHIEDGLLKDLELDDDTMLNWFDRTQMCTLVLKGILNPKYCSLPDKWREFFSFLKLRYNSKYETVFDIEFLETHEQKVAEFGARQHSEQFVKALCKCFICFKVFPRRGLMKYHNKVYHDESSPLKCDICLCGFQSKKQLKHHMQISHEIVYRCKKCPYVTRSRPIMRLHYEQHVNNGIFCTVCDKQFRTVKTMTQHMLCHKRGACCPFCARCFALFGLAMHTRSKHQDDPLYNAKPALPCPECDAAFHYEDALNTHIQRDHTEYRCSCGKVFPDEMSLTTHTKETKHIRIKRETEIGYLRCDICAIDVPYTSSFSLRTHHRMAHPTLPYQSRDKRKNVVLCEHCGLACTLGPEYEDHLNTHSGEKPYECSECGARFATRGLTEHHLKIHSKNKEKVMKNAGVKYKCHVCDKEFGSSYYLRQHTRIHEDFNRVVVTSHIVLPKLKEKTKKPNTLTKIAPMASVSKNKIRLQNEESTRNDGSNVSGSMEGDEGLHDEERNTSNDGSNVSGSMEGDEGLHDEERNRSNDGSKVSGSMECLHNEERSTRNDGSNVSGDESLHDEESSVKFSPEHRMSDPGPGMEVIFDFENEAVEEVEIISR